MGRINLSGYVSSNPPSRERWEEMAEILYGDGSGKKDDRRVGTKKGRRRNRRPTLLNGGLTAEESLPASERTIDPSILYNTEDPDKPLPTSALGSGNAQMDWAIQQNLVNAPKGKSQQPVQQSKFNPNYKFGTVKEVKHSVDLITAKTHKKFGYPVPIQEASRITKSLIQIESSFRPKVKNPNSTASGLMQIVKKTADLIAQNLNTGFTSKEIRDKNEANIIAGQALFFDGWKRYRNVDDRIGFLVLEYKIGANDVKRARDQAQRTFGSGAGDILNQVLKLKSMNKRPKPDDLSPAEYIKAFRKAYKDNT